MAVNIPLITRFDNKGIKSAETALGKFAGSARKTLGGLADFGQKIALGLAGVGVAAGAGAFKAIDAASDLSEEISKTGELFGDSATSVEKFASTAARRLGQSRKDALEAANTFAIFGSAAGLAGEDLVGFSTDFVELSSDLASFNNTSPEDAVQAIGAALRGEAEPLRRYGILLDDATLKQKALELGIYDGNGALSQQQKIRAAEIAIYEQSSAAQGDFARTSEGLANQQRILRAELANVVAQVGEKLLPIALKLAQFFNEKVLPAVQTLADAFSERGLAGVFDLIVGVIQDKGPAIRDGIINFLQSAWDWIRNTGIPALLDLMGRAGTALVEWIEPRIVPMLQAIGDFIGAAANWLIDEGLPWLVDTLIKLGDELVAWIKPKIVPALEALGELLVNILDWVLTDALPKLAEQLLELAAALVSWIVDVTPEVLLALGNMLLDIVDWFFTDAIPTIFDEGVKLGAEIIEGIGSGLSNLFNRLVQFGKDIVNKIVEGIKSAPGAITSAIGDLIPGSGVIGNIGGSIGRGIGSIWPFAKGGIVTAPTVGLVGEAGPEAIIPLDKIGMLGGNTINVTVSSADPEAVVEAIRRYNRIAGPAPFQVAS